MRNSIILLITLALTLSANAENSLYDDIAALGSFQESYHIVPTQTGIDIKSKQTFKNSQGKVEPVTHMELEGPFENADITSLEKGMDFLVNLISQEVDETYQADNAIIPGLSAAIVDTNGTKVGLLNYKMNREPDTYVRRAVLFSPKGLYSYALIMHQSEEKSRTGLYLMAVVISSVNSGKL